MSFVNRNLRNLHIRDLNDRVNYLFDDKDDDGNPIKRLLKFKVPKQYELNSAVDYVSNREPRPGRPLLKYGKHSIM